MEEIAAHPTTGGSSSTGRPRRPGRQLPAACRGRGREAVVVTLDTTMLGWRPRDLDLGHLPFARGLGHRPVHLRPRVRAARPRDRRRARAGAAPPDARRPAHAARDQPPPPRALRVDNVRSPPPRAAVERPARHTPDPTLSWADIATLRTRARSGGAQGRLHPDDAAARRRRGGRRAGQHHGGRQVDGGNASLDALPGVVKAVGDRARRARLRGAQRRRRRPRPRARRPAVLPRRPFAYGLALAGGGRGVSGGRDLLAELDLTLGLAGARTVADLTWSRRRGEPAHRRSSAAGAPFDGGRRVRRARHGQRAVDATPRPADPRGTPTGYFDDVGLTERRRGAGPGEGQGAGRPASARRERRHAARPDRRGTATAVTLRATLLAELGRHRRRGRRACRPRFDSVQFLYGGRARDLRGRAEPAAALRPPRGRRPRHPAQLGPRLRRSTPTTAPGRSSGTDRPLDGGGPASSRRR